MTLTTDTLEELDRLIDIFFEKVGRKERLRKQVLKMIDECEAYLYPKIRDWMQGAREQIIKDIKKKVLKKRAGLEGNLADASLIYISGSGPAEIRKKSKSQIVVDYVDWETIEKEGESIIKPAYLNIMERSGNLSRAQAKIEASFDVINPRSVTWAEKYSSELVTLVGKETKKGLREIVTQGVKEGKTLRGIAKDIEKMGIGLNGRQTKSLYKYRDLLEAQKLPKEVIKDKFDKYYNRLQRDRSELIARTEVNRSVNEGYLDSLEGTRYEEVELSSAGDACSECLDLAGQKFTRAEARGRLPVHPDCRCHWIVVVPRKKKPGVPKKPKVPKKPEEAKWKPTMTAKEADLWSKGSQYADDVFYHGTSEKRATKIGKEGFSLKRAETLTNNGQLFGAGHYISTSPKYAGAYGKKVLKIKVNVKNALRNTKTFEKLEDISYNLAEMSAKYGDIGLADLKRKLTSKKILKALDYIDEKDWKAICKIVGDEKWGPEMVERYMFKKEGYDAINLARGSETVIFDDESLVIIK